MPFAVSDTLAIENTSGAERRVVPMTVPHLLVASAGAAKPEPNVFVRAFTDPANRRSVSPAVFDAEDTLLDWIRLEKKVEGFRALEKGWDGYKAAPPDARPLELAKAFLDLLKRNRYLPSRLVPSVVGGVGMTFRKTGRKVYVEFSNKGTIHLLFSDGATEPVVQKVVPDLPGYRAIIAKARVYLNE